MQGIYKHYIIDMSCNNNFVQVPTVQGDGNNVRGFEVELIANNVQYVVDSSKVHVCIAGTKPDTKQILNDCEITDDGYILVDITQQMSAVAGRGDYCISLMDIETNSLLTSFPFYILATASAYNASEIVSSNEFKTLTNGIATMDRVKRDVEQLIKEVNVAEEARENAENTRISNENTRINNEDIRLSAENDRVTAENLRDAAEQDRVSAELQRISDENTRIDNESDRVSAENSRVSAETTRVSQENTRQDNESVREANEIIRQNQESERQTNTANAIANAETATTNATNATSEATSQAIYAKNQGDYAKSQGDYVKDQGEYAKTQGDYAKEQGEFANLAATNANNVSDDLIAKRDSGYFKGDKGDKGDPGRDGVVTTVNGMIALHINDIGHLILTYSDTDAPNFSINSDGHLIYTFS